MHIFPVIAGAIPEPNENNETPITYAVQNQRYEITLHLLRQFLKGKRHIDVNIADRNGNSYLHMAIECCKTDTRFLNIVDLLIQADNIADLGRG